MVLVEVPRRAPMALLGQPAAARMATSCSAFDKVCQETVASIGQSLWWHWVGQRAAGAHIAKPLR